MSSWGRFCSFWANKLGAEGSKTIAEALKVNTSITNIKHARMRLVSISFVAGCDEIRHSSLPSNHPSWRPFCSPRDNDLGPEGGKAIGEALKINTSITNIR